MAALAAGLLAAPAGAALRFSSEGCAGPFSCARVAVPLDRSGAVPGTLRLYVERAKAQRSTGVVFALAGGPGQGATTLTESFNRELNPAIGRRDLVVFDQRGTGRSGALACAALDRIDERPIDVRTAECAQELGPARSLYTTRESVEDLEAVRAALGAEGISIVGVSYGTKVAVAYAMAHPDRVERLVLDSVVDPEARDPFALGGLAALPRILREVCRAQCAEITPDLAADVAALADTMAAGPLRGPFVDPRGRRRTRGVTARDLYSSIRAADLDPERRAEYPAAVRSAVLGDPAPLLRMEHRYADLELPDVEPPPDAVESLSFSLQAATLCEEEALPWERTASPEERDRQAAEAAAALPDAAFEPFDRATMLTRDANNLLFQCRRWPAAAQAPDLAGDTLPDVPVLVLEGLEDTRTPLEAGAAVAARFPRGVLVTVPKTGHAVLGTRGCARRAARLFFADRAVGDPCAALAGRALLPLAPTTVAEAGGPLRAVLRTLDDLAREQDGRLFGPVRGGGLRAGRFARSGGRLVVSRFSYVPGLALSGRLATRSLAGTIVVSGTAEGRLRLRAGRLRGRLAGEPVDAPYRRPLRG